MQRKTQEHGLFPVSALKGGGIPVHKGEIGDR
jgi:hypothetical protein